MNYLFIAIGGGIGALLRFVSINAVSAIAVLPVPVGTLSVNAVGSLVIGFLYKVFETWTVPAELRLFLTTGFLGGFTTFSTYSLESAQYLLNGNYRQAFFNILLSNVLCLALTIAGMMISRALIRQ
jgi:CrcB protein